MAHDVHDASSAEVDPSLNPLPAPQEVMECVEQGLAFVPALYMPRTQPTQTALFAVFDPALEREGTSEEKKP